MPAARVSVPQRQRLGHRGAAFVCDRTPPDKRRVAKPRGPRRGGRLPTTVRLDCPVCETGPHDISLYPWRLPRDRADLRACVADYADAEPIESDAPRAVKPSPPYTVNSQPTVWSRIENALRDVGRPLTRQELAAAVGTTPGTISSALRRHRTRSSAAALEPVWSRTATRSGAMAEDATAWVREEQARAARRKRCDVEGCISIADPHKRGLCGKHAWYLRRDRHRKPGTPISGVR